jgi:hypothetical protein
MWTSLGFTASNETRLSLSPEPRRFFTANAFTPTRSTKPRVFAAIKPFCFAASKDYPDKLRRIRYFEQQTNKALVFLTNNFTVPALIIAHLYRCRWQVELFFKWIKQHLRIKAFYGTSDNAVKTQIWIAISIYVLVAIDKKRLNLDHSLYSILQILSVTIMEKLSISQILSQLRSFFAGVSCVLRRK